MADDPLQRWEWEGGAVPAVDAEPAPAYRLDGAAPRWRMRGARATLDEKRVAPRLAEGRVDGHAGLDSGGEGRADGTGRDSGAVEARRRRARASAHRGWAAVRAR